MLNNPNRLCNSLDINFCVFTKHARHLSDESLASATVSAVATALWAVARRLRGAARGEPAIGRWLQISEITLGSAPPLPANSRGLAHEMRIPDNRREFLFG